MATSFGIGRVDLSTREGRREYMRHYMRDYYKRPENAHRVTRKKVTTREWARTHKEYKAEYDKQRFRKMTRSREIKTLSQHS